MICITCPLGCSLELTHDGKNIINIEGNKCKKGLDYAGIEFTDPRRIITSTVKVQGGIHPLVPIYTSAPIPKQKIFDLLKELRQVELQAPIRMGQVVLKNALGTDADVLASRSLPAI